MRIREINTVEELANVWDIFYDAFQDAQSLNCAKPMTPVQAFQNMSQLVSQPKDQRLVLVGEEDGKPVTCGGLFVFDGEPWVYIAHAKHGVVGGVRPLLDEAKKWAVSKGFQSLVARTERLTDANIRLFNMWGFQPRALELQIKI